ncbi:TraB/GumN family protein [Candidatus Halobeggiatoa sp. HSG11]|nr:TraB/GumN family protein [Candidatus Halobeggiatoa sp. HSG11]
MKIFTYRWFVVLIYLLFTSNLLAAETQEGIFWQIKKSGVSPSYIFGTIHSEDTRVNKLPKKIRTYFDKADSVSLEMLLDMPTMLKASAAMLFTDEQTLDKVIDAELFAKVSKILVEYQVPEIIAKKLKPWAVIATLSTPPPESGDFLDLFLYKEAMKLEIDVYGLEKVEEQLAVFEELPLENQILLLKETVENIDEMPAMFAKLHELYLKRNLTELQNFSIEYMLKNSKNKSLTKKFYKRIVDNRNITMVDRMAKRLQEGNAFIAVGALHLPGEQGILKMLENKGYKIKSIY